MSPVFVYTPNNANNLGILPAYITTLSDSREITEIMKTSNILIESGSQHSASDPEDDKGQGGVPKTEITES